MSKLLLTSTLFFSLVIVQFHSAHARLNTITGGISVNYDYDETVYDTEYDTTDTTELTSTRDNSYLKKFSIAPLFIYETKSSIDNLTIRFNPSLSYDQEESQSNIDHNFRISAFRKFTNRLRFDLSDSFIYSDDPELIEDDNSSDYNKGRKRYWTNDFILSSKYAYAANSSVGGGYAYRILRNDYTGIGGYEDYDKHTVNISLLHRFNKSWNIDLYTSYTRGLFDPPNQELVERVENGLENTSPGITDDINTNNLSNDLSEYRATTAVNWIFTQNKIFSATHSYTGSNYDALLRNDTNLHNLTFGAQYKPSKRFSFGLGGGPSYEKTETFDRNWDYNAHLNLDYALSKKSNISAGVEKSYDIQNFSQNNNSLGKDEGLTAFWKWQVKLSHKFTPDLNASLWASYRDEQQESILYGLANTTATNADLNTIDSDTLREETVYNRQIYEAGGSLKYSFLQWYTTSLRYTYRQQSSDVINDSYDEHRVFLTLSVQKELLRW